VNYPSTASALFSGVPFTSYLLCVTKLVNYPSTASALFSGVPFTSYLFLCAHRVPCGSAPRANRLRSSANTSNPSDAISLMSRSSIRFFVWHRRHFSISSPRPHRFSSSLPVSQHCIELPRNTVDPIGTTRTLHLILRYPRSLIRADANSGPRTGDEYGVPGTTGTPPRAPQRPSFPVRVRPGSAVRAK